MSRPQGGSPEAAFVCSVPLGLRSGWGGVESTSPRRPGNFQIIPPSRTFDASSPGVLCHRHACASLSLDSYREGRRKRGKPRGEYERVAKGEYERVHDGAPPGGERRSNHRSTASANQKPRPPRTKIGLLKALTRGNVASVETCEVLLRAGFVSVNGVVKSDPAERVDLKEDAITVKGKLVEYDLGEDDKTHVNDWDESVEDESTLTRAQRDFKRGKFGVAGRAERSKKFSRSVDGGFYASKKWAGGK